jgi:tetratricopeptide (TPR) repeat protein
VGQPDAEHPEQVTPSYDDRKFTLDAALTGVSAKQEKIPDVPIVALAEDEVTFPVAAKGSVAAAPKVDLKPEDWQRWNDYGIGLFLQGDLKGAQAAFLKVTEIDPKNPDGWVNLGRTAVQEGDMDAARPVLEKALAISPDLARAHYFYARILRADGKYEDAANHLRTVIAQYPRDRVALNDLGRILFLERKYSDAVNQLEAVLAIDPEDLQAHYNLMLCYGGLGDEKLAKEHQALYLRFKADEASQTITGKYRQLHPEDNNERQTIHEHVSVALNGVGSAQGTRPSASKLTSGAKARSKAAVSGTTEVVPFPSTSRNIGPSTSQPGTVRSSGGQNSDNHFSTGCISRPFSHGANRAVSRYHRAGRNSFRPQQRCLRKEVVAGDARRWVRFHRLRQRRLSRHPAGEWRRLAGTWEDPVDAQALSQQS